MNGIGVILLSTAVTIAAGAAAVRAQGAEKLSQLLASSADGRRQARQREQREVRIRGRAELLDERDPDRVEPVAVQGRLREREQSAQGLVVQAGLGAVELGESRARQS